jgi:hypothetical protein
MQLFSTSFSVRAAALACVALLGACSKKNDTPAPTTTTAGVTWTADNTNYTSTFANATVQGADLYVTGISGATGSANNAISLLVPAATGTYSIAAASGTANYLMSYNINSSSSSATVYVASNLRGNGSGTVTVTTFSATEVIGTFSFTGDNASGGTDTKVITSGKFSVKR